MDSQKTIDLRIWGEIAALSLIWGGSFLAVRIALDEIGPWTVVAHRVGWAALALWGWVLLRRLPLPRDAATWGAFVVMGAFNNVVPFTLMAWGQLHIESGLTSILNAATAVFGVLVAAAVFRDERLTARRLAGVSLGFLGVATAIGLRNLAELDLRSLAQLAVLGGALSYAVSAAWARARLSHVPPQVAAMGMLTGSTLIMLPLAWWREGPMTLALEADTALALAYVSLIASAAAYLIYYRIIAAAGAGNAMVVTLTIPPVAIALGALVRGEALPPQALLGFAVLAAGLLLLNRPRRKPALPSAAPPR
jgi:drug/metabolite transporter (DMT)-like permease